MRSVRPQIAALAGVIFVIIGILYWGLAEIGKYRVDYAGATMLGVLGLAMGLMIYVLVSGLSNE